MSTRSGVPTAATFVFVNMINKLRRDFQPEFFAAVFDVSSPVFRDERAKTMTVRRFNAKTQTFEPIDYQGYKANRTEMPPDLAQQLPYIRRALEAFHIPILQSEGYEADDVIGTLAKQAAEAGHCVFVVSSDKDMLQLVNDQVKVLNPTKDNLVLDREKVVETLGVPPERVVDVMALRGDSIDNIPGAPGIGDKGSVELIQQYGSLEALLDHASEVKRKTYRESLEGNRDTILLSKELVTIHCAVPMELNLDAMRTQTPDQRACRALFTELEFTTMLKELAPEPQAEPVQFMLQPTAEQIAEFLREAREHGFAVALPASPLEQAVEQVSEQETEAIEEREPALLSMSLLDAIDDFEREQAGPDAPPEVKIGVATRSIPGMLVSLTSESGQAIRELLEDAAVPKALHDLKGSLRLLEHHDIHVAGVRDDVMLYSYLINPTHTAHRLGDVAARFSNRPLQEKGEAELAEAAGVIQALAPIMREDVEALQATSVYETIDRPAGAGAAQDGVGRRSH